MVRDDLYITVPSIFRCPISLDIMKSPVSLSTGVTYDRRSIQRWLDDGNDTCPATMQVLQSKDFVPNLTLQRLIQIWSHSARHRRVDSADSPPITSRSQVSDLIRRISSEKLENSSALLAESFSKIVCFARNSCENRRFLAAESSGFVSAVFDLLGSGLGSIDSLEMAVMSLDMIRNEISDSILNSVIQKNRNRREIFLRSLVQVLQKGSIESRIGSARVTEKIASDAESKSGIAESKELLSELLKLISPEKDLNLIEAGLSCLIALSTSRRARTQIVKLGSVKAIKKCLSINGTVTEKALKLLEASASVREGWEEIGGDREIVERVVERVMKVSAAATEHAAAVLWRVCCLHGVAAARDAAAEANGAAKALILMQTDCSPAARQMAAELLRAFRICGSSKSASFVSSCCYDTNTTHIMPF